MEQRILLYAPTGQDGPLAARVLHMAAIDSIVCHSAAELEQQLARGAGGVVTVDEALTRDGYPVLQRHVARQPDWSDLPVIVLTRHGNDTLAVRQAVAGLGNVTLLERPVRTLTLVTSVQAMLRARNKQYLVREAERRKDEFLASLGHELRNPLAPIKTSMAVLHHLYPDAPRVARITDVVERQVTQLTRLVDDLLDVARITSGKIELRRTRVSLGAVLDHAIELCAQAAAAKRIVIERQLPPDAVMHGVLLDADYARVVQILANIVSNAVKFTPPDGRIGIAARVDDALLTVTIRDNGIGLARDAIPRIFSMFEQSQTVAGQMSSGLGIGLSLARQFAEMHGGSVEAQSDGLGAGSVFVVKLPVVVPPSATDVAVADNAGTLPAARPPRVLVVDDNRDAAESLQALFEMEHFEVALAYDGQGAVAAVDAALPDLIVMDLGMPGMDGYEAARLIRQRPGAERILMIALTGWGQDDARRRTLAAGFDHHLIKPIDVGQIIALAATRLGNG